MSHYRTFFTNPAGCNILKDTIRTAALLTVIVFLSIILLPQKGHTDSRQPPADIGNILNSIIKGTATFPERFGINRLPAVNEPDITLTITRNYLNRVIAAYLKNPIALDAYSQNPKSFITVKSAVTHIDPKRNILIVKGEGGVLTLGTAHSGLKGRLELKKAEFEIAPVFSRNKKGQLLLELKPRCIYLDIDKTANLIDISIANTLQELYLNRNPVKPINISELLNSDIKDKDKPLIQNRIDKATLVMSGNMIEIRTTWFVN